MSLAPSPPGSGRSSPVPRRLHQRQDDEELRRQDKGYRKYAAGIERALASFDGARQEWADYISFLGRLLKAIQAHPLVFENIPHKSGIANRLSQCLVPSLPSGVHQRAIETYSTIFALISKDQLARDLTVWLPGLAPVLSFASLSVRPSFLSLLETHIILLNERSLRPALKSLILALLPGLEDETNEDFERTVQIVDHLRERFDHGNEEPKAQDNTSGSGYFWQCLFLATISSTSRRAGALAYLIKRLPKLGPSQVDPISKVDKLDSGEDAQLSREVECVISPEPGLLIRCFSAGLEDEHMLVQRGFLDLLVTHLPLDSLILTSRVDAGDLNRLVAAAIGVVVRRDMSLNRRLWSWFLGAQSSQNNESSIMSPSVEEEVANPIDQMTKTTTYFTEFGLHPLAMGLLGALQQSRISASETARPFRICLSLMDRWEIGRPLVPVIFRPAMERLMSIQQTLSRDEYRDVMRSATSFFDGIESGIIWKELLGILKSALELQGLNDSDRLANLLVVEFVMDNFNVREEDMITVHIPLVAISTLSLLSRSVSNRHPDSRELSSQVLEMATAILERLVTLLPDLKQLHGDPDADDLNSLTNQHEQSIAKYYDALGADASSVSPPFDPVMMGKLLVLGSVDLVLGCLAPYNRSKLQSVTLKVLVIILAKVSIDSKSRAFELIAAFQKFSSTPMLLGAHAKAPSFPTVAAIVQILSQLFPEGSPSPSHALSSLPELLANLVETTWIYLTPSTPKYHIEAVHCLWQLHQLSGNQSIVEATLTASTAGRRIQREQKADRVESARRFAVLWNHTMFTDDAILRKGRDGRSRRESTPFPSSASASPEYQLILHRPLFLLLDSLAVEHTELYHQVKSWIGSMPSLMIIFDILLTKLAQASTTLLADSQTSVSADRQRQVDNEDQTSEALYYLEHMLVLLRLPTQNLLSTLNESRSLSHATDDDLGEEDTLQVSIALACLQIVEASLSPGSHAPHTTAIQHTSLAILQCLLQGPNPADLQELSIDEALIGMLRQNTSSNGRNTSLQIAMLDTILPAVRLRVIGVSSSSSVQAYPKSPGPATFGQAPSSFANAIFNSSHDRSMPPPPNLMKCLQEGISAASSFHALDHWIHCLIEVLPYYSDSLFQNLIPLVECFCGQIRINFKELSAIFEDETDEYGDASEQALTALLSGVEHVLATAHNQLSVEETQLASSKPVEQVQGFFGNVVSGVFSSEVQKTRSALANTRLTVLLCVHDVVRICVMLWTWASPKKLSSQQDVGSVTHNHVALRLRNKSRRILDRMYTAEALECLETLVSIWTLQITPLEGVKPAHIITLVNGLDGARPKNTIPAIFNAIYSRNNPAAIDASRASTLTFDVTDLELSQFLVEYAQSLDDDAMDEIWSDCMAFIRDVMANPIPHATILPSLLLFLLTLSEKIERTNFGEQRKMRKELSETAYRLLQSIFTTRSTGNLSAPPPAAIANADLSKNKPLQARPGPRKNKNSDFPDLLLSILPRLQTVLAEGDRLVGAVTLISAQFISPAIHSRNFPQNMKTSHINLLAGLARASPASKIWKKDVSEAFGQNRFFSSRLEEVNDGWLPLIRQWVSNEKDRLPELASRISAPTSAGMLFGVGANAARLEADKKTQVTLRRIATVILAMEDDFAVTYFQTLEEKLVELLGATAASSPSSSTRAEVYMLLRAIVLKTSSVHLAPLWPLITAELQKAVSSTLPSSHDYDTYNAHSLLQVCRLLDLLLTITPEDYQLQEWLFVTDTIDAVYRSGQTDSVSLADEIAEELGATGGLYAVDSSGQPSTTYKTGLLKVSDRFVDGSKEEVVNMVLRPFFNQLSIHVYEGTYSMKSPDFDGCKQAILSDLFDSGTIIG